MEIDWDFPLLKDDIYRIHKEHLQEILSNFGIKFKEEDTVPELRPVVAALKSFVKLTVGLSDKAQEAKQLFCTLVKDNNYLEEHHLQAHPELRKIQEFIIQRENLYDRVTPQDNEDYLEPIGNTVDQSNTARYTEINMAENLPLISAGTYNGLTTENPNDFIDKYQIAAQSNKWSEHTKINLFPAHLAGTALSWYKHFSSGQNVNNWNTLKIKFIEAFTPIAQAHNLQTMLENKVQGRDQPALNYFLEVLTLCKRYDPNITEKQTIHHIIQGLQPELCERILNEQNNTLDELEENLKKVELQIQIQNQNREKYIRVTSKDNYEQRSRGRSVEDHREELRNIQTEIKTLKPI